MTAYTKGTYLGLRPMRNHGTVSKSTMYGKMSKTSKKYFGGYAIHDHWQVRTVCRFVAASVSAGTSFGVGITLDCNIEKWVRILNDYRSTTFTNVGWWRWLPHSWTVPHFQADRVGLSAATCVAVRRGVDKCSGGTWAKT